VKQSKEDKIFTLDADFWETQKERKMLTQLILNSLNMSLRGSGVLAFSSKIYQL
jgi:hypothetical protein